MQSEQCPKLINQITINTDTRKRQLKLMANPLEPQNAGNAEYPFITQASRA